MKLLDYIRGLRKGKEAHRLEKESMKDPFLADAMDGYHQVEGDHDEQINKLRMKVNAHSAKKRNTYAVTWSIAACLIIGIGISSYFLFLKQNVGEDVFIAKEQPSATATVPAHKEDTSLSAPKMEPDSGRPSAIKETVGKDIIAKSRQDSPSQSTPSRATSATVPKATASKATAPKATPAGTPIMEEIVAPAEELEEAAITTVTDTSFLDTNRKKMKVAQLATQMNNMIKGKVTDDKGEPLIGANVTYKGATYGAITDINGEFSLPKKEGNEILTAHYIGYNPVSIPADTSKTMLIAMHENKTTLDEVVVTGYGAQKKVAVTGAISAVSIKDLKKASGALQKSDTLKDAAISQKADSLQGAVIPEPVTGMKQYKKYLKKNLAYPADDTCAEVKGKVTLTFFVNKEGRPFDIKVKESLCKSLDKEAIRLIQEGPDWTYGNQSAEITVKFHK